MFVKISEKNIHQHTTSIKLDFLFLLIVCIVTHILENPKENLGIWEKVATSFYAALTYS